MKWHPLIAFLAAKSSSDLDLANGLFKPGLFIKNADVVFIFI
jgi:hypothetical protein